VQEIAARELRNHLSAVLRRVERGEQLRVTVSGSAVAELRPLAVRPRSMEWSSFFGDSHGWAADPGLASELADLLPGSIAAAPAV
jgi:prevent-host-death family protein